MSSKAISREKAVELLWEAGELSWKLRGVQSKIREDILNDPHKINVLVACRRTGKSHTMLLIATEFCIKKPGAIVKYACPKQRMVKTIIRPIMRIILEDCPKHLLPEWKEADKMYVFPNGSEIHIAGTDNDNADNLRGSYADLAICDEASYMTDLEYVIRSVLSPTLKTRNGRLILASTPCRDPNHEFVAKFMLPSLYEGRTKIYTIYDNPNFTPEIIKEIISEFPQGEKDPGFLLEYMCQVPDMSDKSILPSFTSEVYKEIVTDQFEVPVYCHKYVSLDPGGTDLTAVLFGFYDYERATLVIIDEIIVDGTTNTAILADLIREKEKLHWSNPVDNTVEQPYKRVSDVSNAILLTDLQKLHGLTFTKTKKDKKMAAINSLDVTIMQKRLIIHPRCQTLLYHARAAEWNNAETEFKRLKDSPTGKIRGGHADALDALIYMHRNVVKTANPFPSNYGALSGPSIFQSLHEKAPNHTQLGQVFSQIFGKKTK
jgi:hypothetical protein